MLKKLLVILVLFVAVFVFTRNAALSFVATSTITSELNVPSRIDKFYLGLIEPVVHIEGLKIGHPENFKEGTMVDIPEIYVRYNPLRIIRGELYFDEIRLHIEEISIVKNEAGSLNFQELLAVNPELAILSRREPEEPKDPDEVSDLTFFIEDLRLKAGRVIYTDETDPSKEARTFNIGIEEQYENISDAAALIQLVTLSVLRQTALPGILNFPMDSLRGLTDKYRGSLEQFDDTIRGTRDAVEDLSEQGKKVLEDLGGLFGGSR